MIRLIIKVSVALLAFLIGVKVALVWNASPPTQQRQLEANKVQPLPIKVSACDLQSDPALYEGKLVSLQAVMYSVNGKLLLYGDCARFENGLPWVDVSEFGELNDLEALLENESKASSRVEKKEADVRVVGMVEKYPGGAEDFISARIVPRKIEPLSPLRKFKPKGAA